MTVIKAAVTCPLQLALNTVVVQQLQPTGPGGPYAVIR